MKLFHENNHYCFSSYYIDQIPVLKCQDSCFEESQSKLAELLCEDMCYLSSNGNGQIAMEVVRIADEKHGNKIAHIISIRCYDVSEKGCIVRHDACVRGLTSLLKKHGYVYHEMSYDDYLKITKNIHNKKNWAIKKSAVRDYGVQEIYTSVPIVKHVDWDSIYSILDGSGCALTIQVIPSLCSETERKTIVQNQLKCSQASNGLVSNLRDSLASEAEKRWNYYSENQNGPMANINILVSGAETAVAIATARIRQAIQNTPLQIIAVENLINFPLYNRPWVLNEYLSKKNPLILEKWTCEETAKISSLPVQDDYFVGAEVNPFSYIPDVDLIPEEMKGENSPSIELGETITTKQRIAIPQRLLVLHTGVFGKSGVGKTTLLKQMIRRLSYIKVPVLVLEPVKREYRRLITKNDASARVFTIESPAIPLLVNPFQVPSGVTLGEYRSSLLSAFKSAFSMPDPLPSLFEKAISEAYLLNGWSEVSKSSDSNVNTFDMADFINIFKRVISTSSYSNEVKGNLMAGGAFRLQSLIERCPRTFDNRYSTDISDLLNGKVILEMGSLEPEQKSLVAALVLISILAYLKATRESTDELNNVILIDEAHAFLDQGDGSTVEEKALNNTMNMLLVNLVTEIRAYGVGIIISDQSPSRIGSKLMDNIDNIISFRLSGEEALLLQKNIGANESISKCLPLLKTGEMIVSNHCLRSPIAVKMNYTDTDKLGVEISDNELVKIQRGYLLKNRNKYCPYKQCAEAGCSMCFAGIRETARKNAMQIFYARQHKINNVEDLAAHIIGLPEAIRTACSSFKNEDFRKISNCTAVHLVRKCALEKGMSLSNNALKKLLSDMNFEVVHKEGSG